MNKEIIQREEVIKNEFPEDIQNTEQLLKFVSRRIDIMLEKIHN